MDDVLASIRRIVRNEKQAEDAEEVMAGDDIRGGGSGRNDAEPLVLTPEMRIERGAETGARPAELAADMAEAAGGDGGDGGYGGDGGALPDREALKAMLRDILREELDGGPAEDAVRGIIRDELTSGEVGLNVSQNVLRLIRSELAKAVETR